MRWEILEDKFCLERREGFDWWEVHKERQQR